MTSTATLTLTGGPTTSEVKDKKLAEFGRNEIELAEAEMPGLMQLRKWHGVTKPLKGSRVTGSLHMTIQTAALIETLAELGADVRWCSCNIFSTQDQAAAAIAVAGTATVFAWKGETLEEYWKCTESALTFPDGLGPDMIVDDGGDATLLVHEGVKAEIIFEKTGALPDPAAHEEADMKCVAALLKTSIQKDSQKWQRISKKILGASEETTTGIHRMKQMSRREELLFSIINVNDCVTKSKFDNIYGCRHSLPDGIMRATDVLIGGKHVCICGFGDVGKGCAAAMKGCGAKVYVTEVDPICALQAAMEGYQVVTLDKAMEACTIFVSATGNKDIIMAKDMAKMKSHSIVGNIGHFDNEVDMKGLNETAGIKRVQIKPQVDKYVFPDGHDVIILAEGRLLNLGCATGHPSFVMSCSFTNQVLAQIELWTHKDKPTYKKPEVYPMAKELDEMVARLHLDSLGATLSKMTKEQADYSGVPMDGPYKEETYRY